jgi:hypothetical protein
MNHRIIESLRKRNLLGESVQGFYTQQATILARDVGDFQ